MLFSIWLEEEDENMTNYLIDLLRLAFFYWAPTMSLTLGLHLKLLNFYWYCFLITIAKNFLLGPKNWHDWQFGTNFKWLLHCCNNIRIIATTKIIVLYMERIVHHWPCFYKLEIIFHVYLIWCFDGPITSKWCNLY